VELFMPDGCRLYSDCVPRDVIVACSSSGMSAALPPRRKALFLRQMTLF
jgi:hypothetical protein